MYLNLVKYLASRFRNRGEPIDDLVQVGTIGLIKAIDRFDIDRQVEFTTYATPTIVGELKRYFRDKGWAIKVPRRLQELSFKVNQAVDALTQRLQRSPTHRGDRRVPRGDARRGPRGDGDERGVQLRLARERSRRRRLRLVQHPRVHRQGRRAHGRRRRSDDARRLRSRSSRRRSSACSTCGSSRA